MRQAPSRSVQVRNARVSCNRRAAAWSSAARTVASRHSSRSPLNDTAERADANNRPSAAGSRVAVAAISPAWASDSSPERNAAAVAGNASNSRAVCNDLAAAPTLTPVVRASQCAAERCPARLPHHRLLHPPRRDTPPRLRQPLTPREQVDQLLGAGCIQRAGLDAIDESLQRGHDRPGLLEHTRHATHLPNTSEPGVSHQPGEAPPSYRTHVRPSTPRSQDWRPETDQIVCADTPRQSDHRNRSARPGAGSAGSAGARSSSHSG